MVGRAVISFYGRCRLEEQGITQSSGFVKRKTHKREGELKLPLFGSYGGYSTLDQKIFQYIGKLLRIKLLCGAEVSKSFDFLEVGGDI